MVCISPFYRGYMLLQLEALEISKDPEREDPGS